MVMHVVVSCSPQFSNLVWFCSLMGVSFLIPGRITISPGVIDTTKARECYILQEKHDKDRDRSRAHGQDKENKRSRYKEKEGCSSSYYRLVYVN